MHFVNKVKHLVKRASSISVGETLLKIFHVLREVLHQYLESLYLSIDKEVSALGKSGKKDTNFFSIIGGKKNTDKKGEGYQEQKTTVLDLGCIAINTVDYIRETLDSIAESFEQHLDNKQLEGVYNFDQEASFSLEVISDIFEKFNQAVQPELD